MSSTSVAQPSAPSGRQSRTSRTAVLTIAAFALVAFSGVLLRPAIPIDETRYLDVAWEMHLTGNWLVPTRNFEIYTHKPPLLF